MAFKMLESDFLLTQLHVPEEWNPQLHHCQNFKPQILCGITHNPLCRGAVKSLVQQGQIRRIGWVIMTL
jgi:hypothetical protein